MKKIIGCAAFVSICCQSSLFCTDETSSSTANVSTQNISVTDTLTVAINTAASLGATAQPSDTTLDYYVMGATDGATTAAFDLTVTFSTPQATVFFSDVAATNNAGDPFTATGADGTTALSYKVLVADYSNGTSAASPATAGTMTAGATSTDSYGAVPAGAKSVLSTNTSTAADTVENVISNSGGALVLLNSQFVSGVTLNCYLTFAQNSWVNGSSDLSQVFTTEELICTVFGSDQT